MQVAAAEAKRAERHQNDDLQQQLAHDRPVEIRALNSARTTERIIKSRSASLLVLAPFRFPFKQWIARPVTYENEKIGMRKSPHDLVLK